MEKEKKREEGKEVKGEEERGENNSYAKGALDKQNINYIRRAIKWALLQQIGVKLIIIGQLYISKAIYYKYINNKAVIKVVVKGDKDKDKEDNLFNIQTRHSFKIRGGIYRRLIIELLFSIKS